MSRITVMFDDPLAKRIRTEASLDDKNIAAETRLLVKEALYERERRRKHEAESA